MSSPDPFEKCIRFACGFVFGAMVGTLMVARDVTALTPNALGVVALISLATGLLAIRYGDEFWRSLTGWFQ